MCVVSVCGLCVRLCGVSFSFSLVGGAALGRARFLSSFWVELLSPPLHFWVVLLCAAFASFVVLISPPTFFMVLPSSASLGWRCRSLHEIEFNSVPKLDRSKKAPQPTTEEDGKEELGEKAAPPKKKKGESNTTMLHNAPCGNRNHS